LPVRIGPVGPAPPAEAVPEVAEADTIHVRPGRHRGPKRRRPRGQPGTGAEGSAPRGQLEPVAMAAAGTPPPADQAPHGQGSGPSAAGGEGQNRSGRYAVGSPGTVTVAASGRLPVSVTSWSVLAPRGDAGQPGRVGKAHGRLCGGPSTPRARASGQPPTVFVDRGNEGRPQRPHLAGRARSHGWRAAENILDGRRRWPPADGLLVVPQQNAGPVTDRAGGIETDLPFDFAAGPVRHRRHVVETAGRCSIAPS